MKSIKWFHKHKGGAHAKENKDAFDFGCAGNHFDDDALAPAPSPALSPLFSSSSKSASSSHQQFSPLTPLTPGSSGHASHASKFHHQPSPGLEPAITLSNDLSRYKRSKAQGLHHNIPPRKSSLATVASSAPASRVALREKNSVPDLRSKNSVPDLRATSAAHPALSLKSSVPDLRPILKNTSQEPLRPILKKKGSVPNLATHQYEGSYTHAIHVPQVPQVPQIPIQYKEASHDRTRHKRSDFVPSYYTNHNYNSSLSSSLSSTSSQAASENSVNTAASTPLTTPSMTYRPLFSSLSYQSLEHPHEVASGHTYDTRCILTNSHENRPNFDTRGGTLNGYDARAASNPSYENRSLNALSHENRSASNPSYDTYPAPNMYEIGSAPNVYDSRSSSNTTYDKRPTGYAYESRAAYAPGQYHENHAATHTRESSAKTLTDSLPSVQPMEGRHQQPPYVRYGFI